MIKEARKDTGAETKLKRVCDSCAAVAPREVQDRVLRSKQLEFMLQIPRAKREQAMDGAVEVARRGALSGQESERLRAQYGLSRDQMDVLSAWAELQAATEREAEPEPEPEPN